MNLSKKSLAMAALLVMGMPAMASADTLYRQLEITMSGSDVGSLQTFLASDASLYPQGLVTNYFGVYTKAAVARFQTRNDISPVGRVGPITLPIINAQMAGSVGFGADVWSPILSNLNINAGQDTATVSWNTSEQARGTVYHSKSPLMVSESLHAVSVSGSAASTDSSLRSSHSIVISGLERDTTYYYLVHSVDAGGNVTITMPATFKTN